jgi:hypothetical protein
MLRGRSLASALGVFLCLALFTAHACVRSRALADIERGKEGRSWEDLSLATSYYLHGQFPVAAWAVRADFFPRDDPAFVAFRADLREETARAAIRPWQFWRTVPGDRFVDRGPRHLAAISDDAGRARLLGWAFGLLRGISPYLVSWLAVMACLPVLAWIGWEFQEAGRPLAAITFLGLFALWPFAVETLQLPYSAAGFYLLGALALVAFAVYSALGPSASPAGLLARVAAAGAVLGIASACRHGALFLVPAFVVCLAWALRRVRGGRPRVWQGAALVAGTGVLVAPYLAFSLLTNRLAQETARAHGAAAITVRHRPWLSLWEGLGDFDRTKGYEWRDAAARRFVAEEGAGRLLSPRSERLFKAKVLRDVREDPSWYLAILGKRILATATQWKLRPWGWTDGRSVAAAASPNEGLVDAYYRLTTTADWLGIADRRVEVPLVLLWLPPLALLVLPLVRREGDDGRRRSGGAGDLAVVAVVGLGLGALPVLVSTASALETQSFVLVYFLGIAFLTESLVREARGRRAARPRRDADGA